MGSCSSRAGCGGETESSFFGFAQSQRLKEPGAKPHWHKTLAPCACLVPSFPAMTPLTALWLPVLVSAVIVFVASSILHMVLPWHRSDYRKLPNEDKFMDTLRPLAIPPGDYLAPRPGSREEMRSSGFAEKFKKGPVVVMTVLPADPCPWEGTWLCGSFTSSWLVSSPRMWPGRHCLAMRTTLRSFVLPAWPHFLVTRWRSGPCPSGIGAHGLPPSRQRSMD